MELTPFSVQQMLEDLLEHQHKHLVWLCCIIYTSWSWTSGFGSDSGTGAGSSTDFGYGVGSGSSTCVYYMSTGEDADLSYSELTHRNSI